MKLLLTSVFGPFGVDDKFGRKENILELFHNQVTREQGVFSLRMNHESFGLHLIAENISVPTAILDFPSLKRFISEIKKGYDYIGISFIVPNFIKAKHMATLVRKYSPATKIILGGHGTGIENLEERIECDYVCRGDGIAFMRNLFGNDTTKKINHPIRYSSFNKFVMGATGKKDAGIIMTGVGCPNACRFCSTTHYFNKQYIPFLTTGKEVFDVCRKMEEKLGVTEFFVMDENFLKHEKRVRELVKEMENHGKAYSFGIFSSAEAVTTLGLDFIDRLGVSFLWMGVESKREVYEKNQGIDFKKLIQGLRDRGVSVLASGILFLEHHTKQTIYEDIDFMIGLNADLVQFMQLGPLPGTQLYDAYKAEEKLCFDIPFEEWHGQHKIWFTHPSFSGDDSEIYLKMAFSREFETNGPSILRIADTAIRGVVASQDYKTPFMKKRHETRRQKALELYPLLDSLCTHAPGNQAYKLASDVSRRFDRFFKKRPVFIKVQSAAVKGLILKEKLRDAFVRNNLRQPKTFYTTYRMMFDKLKEGSFAGYNINRLGPNTLKIKTVFSQLSVQVKLSGILDRKNIKTMQSSILKFLKSHEKGGVVLNLSNLRQIDEDALRIFLKKIEGYKHRLQLVYSRNVESTRMELENLMNEFSKFSWQT